MSQDRLTWLADVLRDAGCRVVEEGDWQHRGRPSGDFHPRAIMLHHDASPPGQTSNGADVLINGRDDLDGPLCHLWLAYDGSWHIIAAGRANHAGEGDGWGVVARDQGNRDSIGIETDHTTDERWSDPQLSQGNIGVRALVAHMGIDVNNAVTAHKEYAPGRKIDPDPANMDNVRAALLAPLEDGYVKQIRKSNSVAQVIEADGKWHTIRLSKSDDPTGVNGVTAGPWHWTMTCDITTAEMPAGAVLLMRAVSTLGDMDNVESGAPVGAQTASARSAQHFQYSAQDYTPEGQWLRMQVQTTARVSLTLVETATTLW